MSKYGHKTHDWFEAVINKLGGEAGADAFLRNELGVVRVAKQAVWSILNFITTTTVSFSARPGDTVGEFFKLRDGLYVWDNFRDLMDDNWLASTIQTIPATKISYYDLKKSANDLQINREFEYHKTPFVFENLGVLLAVLTSLILAQWNNEKEGPLLVNEDANLFYVRVGSGVFTVSVCWSANARFWYVFTTPQGVIKRDVGDRVFSSNEVSE
ncbi:MAG: hypothetical protein HY225_00005, partial [Candidatus Vogelbacteria bacterium]|nr:hypothetical protein [Candidatus Vogelbacteria bacterium]